MKESKVRKKRAAALCFIFLCTAAALSALEVNHLAAFSDPARIWGNGVERVIEEAFRACFRTRIIDGRVMNIRMPFAMNNDRDLLSETRWEFVHGGKGTPDMLWPIIDDILASEDFARFVQTLGNGREQVIEFDIPNRRWHSSRDHADIARMRAGLYQGLPHRPLVLVTGGGIEEADVYNFLYSIGHVGMDCSGFVFFVLSHIARQGGLNLGNALRRVIGVPRGADPALFVGTSFFNSRNRYIDAVNDSIINLRPADVLLFRNATGGMSHAAIIQSINFEKGIIRYLQSTDEAPQYERGVHDSFIYFDPARPYVSLNDPSLIWTKQRHAPFPGENPSPFSNDGERYRAFGGGRVVRLNILTPIIERLNRQ